MFYFDWLASRVRANPRLTVAMILVAIVDALVVRAIINASEERGGWTHRAAIKVGGCAIETRNGFLSKVSQATKSRTYNPLLSDEENAEFVKNCITTTWHVIHFVGHIVIAFVAPMFWPEILMLSTAFEFYEYFTCKCHDVTDIGYNTVGVAIGLGLRRLLVGDF